MPRPRYRVELLSELIEGFDAGVSVNSEDRPSGPGEHGVLKVSAVAIGRFIPSENKAILARDTPRMGPSVRAGDLLVTRANTHDLVGAAALVPEDFPWLHLSDKTWRARLRSADHETRRWLAHVLTSPAVRSELRRRASGTSGSMKNISQSAFLRIRVATPPQELRGRLADVLDTMAMHESVMLALLAAKRRFKRGLTQKLLTGRVRFPKFETTTDRRQTPYGELPSDWRYERIGDIAQEVSHRAGAGHPGPVLACSKHNGLVDSIEYFGRRIFSEDTSLYKVIRQSQFAFPTNHIEEGSIGLLRDQSEGLVSPIYVVFEATDRVVPEFLYAVFKSETYRHIFAAATNSSVNRRGNLRWAEFAKLRVPLPTTDEQQGIAAALDAVDREIIRLERLSKLHSSQKQALLDRLLSGELPVPEQ